MSSEREINMDMEFLVELMLEGSIRSYEEAVEFFKDDDEVVMTKKLYEKAFLMYVKEMEFIIRQEMGEYNDDYSDIPEYYEDRRC